MVYIKRKFIAVIHARGTEHGAVQAARALGAGASGVALIDQFCSARDVYDLALGTKRSFPSATVLVNILDDNNAALRCAGSVGFGCKEAAEPCGVWLDRFDPDPEDTLEALLRGGFPVFAGVGFKYQRESELESGWNLAYAKHFARARAPYVPMTSGVRTGQAPDLSKLRAYRALLGPDCPLAVASGVTPGNLESMLPLATHFLVGTSIEVPDSSGEVDPARAAALATIVGAYNAEHDLK